MVSLSVHSETHVTEAEIHPANLYTAMASHTSQQPALATLGRINELANYLFHPSNTSLGLNLHHHLVTTLLNPLHAALEHAFQSMQAQVQARSQESSLGVNVAQIQAAQSPITFNGAPVRRSGVTIAGGYQFPNTFLHDVTGVGAWTEGQ